MSGAATGPAHELVDAGAANAFQLNRDRRFLWLGARHRDVFEMLHGAIVRGLSLVVLTGEAGSGKTMLVDAVTARLGKSGTRVIIGWIAHPSRDADDFWNAIACGFGLGTATDGRDTVRAHFVELVRQAESTSARVLLVIDEAQALSGAVLAEVMHASDTAAEMGAPSTLSVVLVGQDWFEDVLAAPEHAALARRIAMRLALPRLREDEVDSYLRHRLGCVQAPADAFTPGVVEAITKVSGGIPRLINAVCARAAAKAGVLDATAVERCGQELFCLRYRSERARAPSHDALVRPRRRSMVAAMLTVGGFLALASATSDDARPTARTAPTPIDMPRPVSRAPSATVPGVVAPTPDVPRDRPASENRGNSKRSVSGADQPAIGSPPGVDTDAAAASGPQIVRGVRKPAPPPAPAPDDAADPRAIIDWLLKKGGQPKTTGH
jgi:type II secretory pathway predicted ATPase ExeA